MISTRSRIETSIEHIIIEIISTDPGADKALSWLVGKELWEHVQGTAVKAEAVHYHGSQSFTVRDLERRHFGQDRINHAGNPQLLAQCSDQAKGRCEQVCDMRS